MPTFNLVKVPWIPVLDASTDLRAVPDAPVTLRNVGLLEVLARAHEIREVCTDNPLETIALNRLLLALFIDAVSPEPDEKTWTDLWETGHLPEDRLAAYFTAHANAFDLLHPERPFYQHPQQLAKTPAPLSKLFPAEASGNNGTLFGHEVDEQPRLLALDRVARGLICFQAAALGGGVSTPFNLSHAPLIGRAVFWLRGKSLFEALMLNAPPDEEARMYDDEDGNGQPTWAKPLPELHQKRPVNGYLDLLTWQARRLTLVTDTENDTLAAIGIYLTQGDKDDPAAVGDPLVATVVSKKGQRFPYGFRADRAVWRDAHVFFNLYDSTRGEAPPTFQWLVYTAPYVAKSTTAALTEVDIFGLVNDKAKGGAVAARADAGVSGLSHRPRTKPATRSRTRRCRSPGTNPENGHPHNGRIPASPTAPRQRRQTQGGPQRRSRPDQDPGNRTALLEPDRTALLRLAPTTGRSRTGRLEYPPMAMEQDPLSNGPHGLRYRHRHVRPKRPATPCHRRRPTSAHPNENLSHASSTPNRDIMTETQPHPDNHFVNGVLALERVDTGPNRAALARLRRSFDRTGIAYTALSDVGRLLPDDVKNHDLDAYLLTAGLFALHLQNGKAGTLGESLRTLRRQQSVGQESLDRRFTAVLNSDAEDLPYRLRQVMHMLKQHNVPVNYFQLLRDLKAWNAESRYVQRKWATDYWTK